MIFAESCWRRNCWWLNRYKESIFQEKLLKFSIICLPNQFLLSFYSRYSRCFIMKTFRNKWLLEIRKSQDLAKDLGGTASKAEKKICQSKIVSYIQKHNKTVIPKMETKWKEKEEKRRKEKKRKEKKRSEQKKVLPRCELRPFGAPGESFTTRPRGTHTPHHGIFII